MIRKRWKVIYGAFALSIGFHLAFGPLVHVKFVDAAPEQKPRIIHIVYIKPPTPQPTKPPKPPKPVHPTKPRTTSQQPIQVHTVHQNSTPDPNAQQSRDAYVAPSGNPPVGPTGDGGIGSPGPTPEPTIAPTPKPVCSAPYVEAKTVNKVPPDVPTMAVEQGLTGTAQVKVDLSAEGQVLGASIYQSTGSPLLDRAAITAAKRTTYEPKIVDCAKVPGSYLFRVEFENQ